MLQHLLISTVGNGSKERQDWASKPVGRAVLLDSPTRQAGAVRPGRNSLEDGLLLTKL